MLRGCNLRTATEHFVMGRWKNKLSEVAAAKRAFNDAHIFSLIVMLCLVCAEQRRVRRALALSRATPLWTPSSSEQPTSTDDRNGEESSDAQFKLEDEEADAGNAIETAEVKLRRMVGLIERNTASRSAVIQANPEVTAAASCKPVSNRSSSVANQFAKSSSLEPDSLAMTWETALLSFKQAGSRSTLDSTAATTQSAADLAPTSTTSPPILTAPRSSAKRKLSLQLDRRGEVLTTPPSQPAWKSASPPAGGSSNPFFQTSTATVSESPDPHRCICNCCERSSGQVASDELALARQLFDGESHFRVSDKSFANAVRQHCKLPSFLGLVVFRKLLEYELQLNNTCCVARLEATGESGGAYRNPFHQCYASEPGAARRGWPMISPAALQTTQVGRQLHQLHLSEPHDNMSQGCSLFLPAQACRVANHGDLRETGSASLPRSSSSSPAALTPSSRSQAFMRPLGKSSQSELHDALSASEDRLDVLDACTLDVSVRAFARICPPALVELSPTDCIIELLRPLPSGCLPRRFATCVTQERGNIPIRAFELVAQALVARHPHLSDLQDDWVRRQAYVDFTVANVAAGLGGLGVIEVPVQRIRKSKLAKMLHRCASKSLGRVRPYSQVEFSHTYGAFRRACAVTDPHDADIAGYALKVPHMNFAAALVWYVFGHMGGASEALCNYIKDMLPSTLTYPLA